MIQNLNIIEIYINKQPNKRVRFNFGVIFLYECFCCIDKINKPERKKLRETKKK